MKLSASNSGNDLEQVTEFTYLGACMAENNSSNASIHTKNCQGTKLIWKATECIEGQGSPSNY